MTPTTEAGGLTRMSYSRLSSWLICPRQYAYRYIERAPDEVTPLSLIFGTAIHEAVEHFMLSLKTDSVMSEAEVHGAFAARLNEEIVLAESLDAPIDWGKSTRGETLAKGEAMLSAFLEGVDRDVKVVDTEAEFDLVLPTGHQVKGFIDLILDDGNDSYRVVDLKTAARSYGPDKIDYDQQPTIYLEAARQLLGVDDGVNFEYWVLTKTKVPKFEIVPAHRTERDWVELLETVEDVQQGISSCAYHRRRGWQCSGCQYAKRCSA